MQLLSLRVDSMSSRRGRWGGHLGLPRHHRPGHAIWDDSSRAVTPTGCGVDCLYYRLRQHQDKQEKRTSEDWSVPGPLSPSPPPLSFLAHPVSPGSARGFRDHPPPAFSALGLESNSIRSGQPATMQDASGQVSSHKRARTCVSALSVRRRSAPSRIQVVPSTSASLIVCESLSALEG